jgi:hypothetical protein
MLLLLSLELRLHWQDTENGKLWFRCRVRNKTINLKQGTVFQVGNPIPALNSERGTCKQTTLS